MPSNTLEMLLDEAHMSLKNLRDFVRENIPDNMDARNYLEEAQEYIGEAAMALFPPEEEE